MKSQDLAALVLSVATLGAGLYTSGCEQKPETRTESSQDYDIMDIMLVGLPKGHRDLGKVIAGMPYSDANDPNQKTNPNKK